MPMQLISDAQYLGKNYKAPTRVHTDYFSTKFHKIGYLVTCTRSRKKDLSTLTVKRPR